MSKDNDDTFGAVLQVIGFVTLVMLVMRGCAAMIGN
jgi:hypothetical protein